MTHGKDGFGRDGSTQIGERSAASHTFLSYVLFLLIGVASFSFAVFKLDNPVWLAAFVGPVFMMRFVRGTRWPVAIILGFVGLVVASFIGMIPQMSMMSSVSVKMSFRFILMWQLRSGALFYVPSFLLPFVLDKALYKRLPLWASSLIYPSAVVAIEWLFCVTVGAGYAFGDSLITVRPLALTASLFGALGLSFIVTWFAPMMNGLWDRQFRFGKLGVAGAVYSIAMALLLLYGAALIALPARADRSVMIAGITLDNRFYQPMSESGMYVSEIFQLSPREAADLMSSPESQLEELRRKTRQAAMAGTDLVIWQEYAAVLESSQADQFVTEMRALADEEDLYLLMSYGRVVNEGERNQRIMRNLSVFITPDGEVAWEYDKKYPARGYEDRMVETHQADIPWIDTPWGRIGQVICVDMIYPHYLRQASRNNIDLLMVPSFDTAFMTPMLTLSSAYRAVENGFTMIRVTGDGLSAVIDPMYRQWAGQNSFLQGTPNFYANVPVISRTTAYPVTGAAFPSSNPAPPAARDTL
jgi:apolipoprotein N-acyltransferase